eukprot:UN12258
MIFKVCAFGISELHLNFGYSCGSLMIHTNLSSPRTLILLSAEIIFCCQRKSFLAVSKHHFLLSAKIIFGCQQTSFSAVSENHFSLSAKNHFSLSAEIIFCST